MVIYGYRSATLLSKDLPQLQCAHCGEKGGMHMHIFRRHAHVFWVPLFPIGKHGVSECTACEDVRKKKEMDMDTRSEYDIAKMEAKGPIWQFSGSLIIALIAIYSVFAGKQDTKQELEYLNDPQVGDVYQYKTEGGNYSLFRIEAVDADSVVILENDYEVDGISGLSGVDLDSNYTTLYYKRGRNELAQSYSDDNIIDITRPEK